MVFYLSIMPVALLTILMKKHTQTLLWLFIFTTALTSCDRQPEVENKDPDLLTAESEAVELPSPLVDGDWLAARNSDSGLHILELGRSRDEYTTAHIPGAKFIDWRTDISDPSMPERYNLPPQDQHEKLLSKLGITANSTIVLYDTMSNRASVRMYWILKYYGHADIRVLDGGLNAWERSGYALTDEIPNWTETSYEVQFTDHDLLVDINYVSHNLSDSSLKLVDGRPFDQYTGESPGKVFHTGIPHTRGGHIYGAKTVPWADNLREDGSFKSPDELTGIYQNHEIFNEGVVVTYCNEGLHAAMPWFVLHELLGYEDVRLYDDSMAEWANIFDTPMITGEHCM